VNSLPVAARGKIKAEIKTVATIIFSQRQFPFHKVAAFFTMLLTSSSAKR
jgi:hypothetical protein